MILDREDYENNMLEHLSTSGSYKKLSNNPLSKITMEVKRAIKLSLLDDRTKRLLTPNCPITPRIYGLPKIHKQGVPLRPIVNTIDSPTYDLAKYLTGILKPLVGNMSSFIKDSSSFVKMISNLTLEPEDIMVSFDVFSLSTKIPIDDVVDAFKKVTNPDIMKLIEVCLRSTFLSFLG